MKIYKFQKFNEDVQIPVLDVVIDNSGNLYNGKIDGFRLTKGTIEQSIVDGYTDVTGIIGSDGKRYPAGIDKNGEMVCVNIDPLNDGYVRNDEGEKIRIPKNVKDKYPKLVNTFWEVDFDYSFLIPILPTGWVNTKIDMEIIKKVRRFGKNIGTNNKGFSSFLDKLDELNRISSGFRQYRSKSKSTIQKEMAVIILLHYINEVKDFFTPTSSGFLFEGFLGGLIPNSKVKEDNSKCDIFANNKRYQCKLYSNITDSINITYDIGPPSKKWPDGEQIPMDYYLICLKYPDKIEICVLVGDKDEATRNGLSYYEDFKTGGQGKSFKVEKLKRMTNNKYTLQLTNIDEKIDIISKGLKDTLGYLFGELSDFQYNVETIISGVDENGKVIDGKTFNEISNNSKANVENMKTHLDKLINNLSKNDQSDQLTLF